MNGKKWQRRDTNFCEKIKKWMITHKKLLRMAKWLVITIGFLFFLLISVGIIAQATGLVDDTINANNRYSQYPLDNFQVDFYVDSSWDWLPWNWGDGIGKQVMYGLYAITNFIWTISLYLSNATGYLIQEAYKLDFITDTAEAIGKNMQTIAGVSANGFSNSGFYVGFLLLLVLIIGIYVAYTGLIKRETSKATRSVINFIVVFILSASFIAYAPDYIKKINDFSKDVSTASLDIGTKMILPHSESKGKDSVDLIRDALFSIQVEQPWLLLQYGDSDKESLGEERVEELIAASPNLNDGKDREEIIKTEIEEKDNSNLTITKTINRLGTVFFLFFFNIGISVFVFLLTATMIFSQVLFILYAMFLPVSFLMSMVPTFEGTSKRAITKLFNTIMARAGITLIITVAFSISTMLYTLSTNSPFFLIAFLQMVTFGGIYFKLGDLMSLFALQGEDSQSMGRQMMRRPRQMMSRQTRQLQRKITRSMGGDKKKYLQPKTTKNVRASTDTHTRPNQKNVIPKNNHQEQVTPIRTTAGKRLGKQVGTVLDSKNRVIDNVKRPLEKARELPTNTKYAAYKGKQKMFRNLTDFQQTVGNTQQIRQQERLNQRKQRQATIAQRRLEMERAKQLRQNVQQSPKEKLQVKNSISQQPKKLAKATHERINIPPRRAPKRTQEEFRKAVRRITVKKREITKNHQRKQVIAMNNSNKVPKGISTKQKKGRRK